MGKRSNQKRSNGSRAGRARTSASPSSGQLEDLKLICARLGRPVPRVETQMDAAFVYADLRHQEREAKRLLAPDPEPYLRAGETDQYNDADKRVI